MTLKPSFYHAHKNSIGYFVSKTGFDIEKKNHTLILYFKFNYFTFKVKNPPHSTFLKIRITFIKPNPSMKYIFFRRSDRDSGSRTSSRKVLYFL